MFASRKALLSTLILTGLPETVGQYLSRFFHDHKWSLKCSVLRTIFCAWGILLVDLFAMNDNRKCCQFCFQAGHSPSSLTDAFLLWWGPYLMYAFLSTHLIPQVILISKQAHARIILITPSMVETVLVLGSSQPLHLASLDSAYTSRSTVSTPRSIITPRPEQPAPYTLAIE